MTDTIYLLGFTSCHPEFCRFFVRHRNRHELRFFPRIYCNMGGSQSSNSRDYKQQLGYYSNLDKRPLKDQNYIIVEQRHLQKILIGEFSTVFEDEDVEHVWIYHCALHNAEGAKIGATVLGSVSGVATVFSFVPVASKCRCINSLIQFMHYNSLLLQM